MTAAVVTLATAALAACSPPDAHGRHVVELTPQRDLSPASVAIASGDQVTWWNHDDTTHRLVIEALGVDAEIRPGDVLVVSFDRPGTYLFGDPGVGELIGTVDVAGDPDVP